MIPLLCPQCRQTLQIPNERAGAKGKCPFCQAIFVVPGEALVSSLPRSAASLDGREARTLPPRAQLKQDAAAASLTEPGDGDKALPSELYDFLAPPQAADEIGRLGSYRVLKVLGAGGMGVVFQAEDPKLNRLVALKAMLPALAASGSNKERFIREARAAAAIEHDHIIPIFQVDEERGVPFIAMPLLRGEALEDRLKKQRKLPLAEALRIAKETAEGLSAAHERNMIHRDIKPANIWLEGEKGRVKILDFGLARSARGESNLTQQGAIVGTPAYMAPEQANGRPVDFRCDLFSLGCVLYRMAAGQLPFKGADTVSTLIAVSTAQPKPPHRINPNVPLTLSRFILRLLAKNPADRPASADEVVALLEKMASEPATRETPTRRSARQEEDEDDERTLAEASNVHRRRQKTARPIWPWFAAGAGIGGVILAALIAVVSLLKQTTPPSNRPVEVARSKDALPVQVPADNKMNVQPVKPPLEIPAGDQERAVAEWVLTLRGNVGVTPADGKRYSTNAINCLPKGAFHVHQIFLENNRQVSDEDLRRITGMPRLEWLRLTNTPISDAGLAHVRDLPKLIQVEVQRTRVTDMGIQQLRAAFPRCNIRR